LVIARLVKIALKKQGSVKNIGDVLTAILIREELMKR